MSLPHRTAGAASDVAADPTATFGAMWDTPEIVGACIGGASALFGAFRLGLAVGKRREESGRKTTRRALGARMAAGNALAAEVEVGDPMRDFSDEERRIAAWTDDTVELLQRDAPEHAALFMNNAGMTFYSSQYGERDRLRNHMVGRLARLGEIIGRL